MRRLFAFVTTVILVDTMFLAALVPLLPEYVDELGISKAAAGILSAAYAAGTLLAALPTGWITARIGVRLGQNWAGGLEPTNASPAIPGVPSVDGRSRFVRAGAESRCPACTHLSQDDRPQAPCWSRMRPR